MHRINARLVVGLAAGLVAVIGLVACGSNDSSNSSTVAATTNAGSTAGASSATISLADNPDLGQIIVDSQGMTVYLFEKDTTANSSTCSGACAQAWPPVTSKGAAKAGSGLDASMLTTFKRDDGSTQVAYAGHPLYLFSGDGAAGEANGNGSDAFGAAWWALDSSGQVVQGSSSGDSSTTTGSGGSGYSY